MELNREVVKFRDGTELAVMEANWAISMRLQNLEEQAEKNPLENGNQQTLNLSVYPKLLACSSGKVPTFEEALEMPSAELDKWYLAVKRMNPQWFIPIISETPSEEILAKKETTPIESTPSS